MQVHRLAEGVQRRDAALLHRRRRQARRAADVADREDRRHRGPELVVDRDAPALVGLAGPRSRARAPPSTPGGRWRTARSPSGSPCRTPAASSTRAVARRSTPATSSLSRKVTFWRRRRYCSDSPISPSRNSSTRVRWSTIVTFVPSAPNMDAYSMPITPAPTTVIVRGTRCLSFRIAVGVDDRRVVEVDVGRARRPRADGDDDVLGGVVGARGPSSRRRGSCARRRSAVAEEQADVVAAQLVAHDRRLGADDARRHVHQVLHRRALVLLGMDRVGHVQRPAGQLVEDRLAQRLGRDRAGVDRVAADAQPPLDDRDALAELGGLDRRRWPLGPGADDDEVEVHAPSGARPYSGRASGERPRRRSLCRRSAASPRSVRPNFARPVKRIVAPALDQPLADREAPGREDLALVDVHLPAHELEARSRGGTRRPRARPRGTAAGEETCLVVIGTALGNGRDGRPSPVQTPPDAPRSGAIDIESAHGELRAAPARADPGAQPPLEHLDAGLPRQRRGRRRSSTTRRPARCFGRRFEETGRDDARRSGRRALRAAATTTASRSRSSDQPVTQALRANRAGARPPPILRSADGDAAPHRGQRRADRRLRAASRARWSSSGRSGGRGE